MICTVIRLPYGLFCFFQPSFLGDATGVSFSSPTGSTELRAMYGGLQSAIGLLALAGALRASVARPALVALVFICAGLGSARLLGTLVGRRRHGWTPAPASSILIVVATPTDADLREWETEFEAAARRPLALRLRYAFIRTYKPVLDDAAYRSFDTTVEYRAWCEANLPSWLGYGRQV